MPVFGRTSCNIGLLHASFIQYQNCTGGTTLVAATAVHTLSCNSKFLRRFLQNSNIKPMCLLKGKWSILAQIDMVIKFPNWSVLFGCISTMIYLMVCHSYLLLAVKLSINLAYTFIRYFFETKKVVLFDFWETLKIFIILTHLLSKTTKIKFYQKSNSTLLFRRCGFIIESGSSNNILFNPRRR